MDVYWPMTLYRNFLRSVFSVMLDLRSVCGSFGSENAVACKVGILMSWKHVTFNVCRANQKLKLFPCVAGNMNFLIDYCYRMTCFAIMILNSCVLWKCFVDTLMHNVKCYILYWALIRCEGREMKLLAVVNLCRSWAVNLINICMCRSQKFVRICRLWFHGADCIVLSGVIPVT